MIRLFLKDQLPWLLFFLFILGWINLLLYLDISLKSISALYLNSTSLFFLLVFLAFHYFRLAKRLKNNQFSTYKAASIVDLFEMEQERLMLEAKAKEQALSVQFQEQTDEQIHWIHEIKTPLTAQRLMLDRLPNVDNKMALELEWARIHLLLDQTLHTLRMQSLEQDLILQKVELETIMTKEIKTLQSLFMAKDLAIDIDEVTDEVYSDSKWLQFIIRQILSNAIKYSDIGSTITIASETANNGQINLVIADQGYGIAAQDIPRIFQRGFTGLYGRQQYASTGMGLYLAKNIADKLKIRLQVQSTLHQGTTIRLFFPKPNDVDKIRVK